MRPLPAVLALALLLTACNGDPGATASSAAADAGEAATSSDDAVDVEVRPFTEIQDSEVTFERDPADPSRMILHVTTTEPSICAIVWGEDESFGRFNNSLSMDGTGIVQHDVILPDVEADTEYAFVLQGTTADGTLFRSEVDTFDTGEAPTDVAAAQVDRGENLAEGAEVEASSTFGDAFAPGNAVDGDLSTEWSSAGDGDGATITVDLGEEREIGAIAFITRSMADGSAITERFTATTDAGEVTGPHAAGTPADPRVAEVDLTARTLTFEVVESTGGNVGAVEVLVYGPQG